MILFKQAQYVIKSSYLVTCQDTPSPAGTQSNTYCADNNQNARYEKDQIKAQEIIQKTPTSGQGYLLSVIIYQKQNNLSAAIKMCLQGLQFISVEDYPDQYTQLQKEKEKILEKQAKCSQNGFFHLLPYPIICMIFDKVSYRDLLCCTSVCRQWFDFIMVEFPCFWNKIMPGKLSSKHQSNMDALVRHETREYRLTAGDPKDYYMLRNIFVLLPMLRNSHSVQKLHFSYPSHWYTDDIRSFGAVIRCLSLTLKELEINCCTMDDAQIFTYLTDVCSPTLAHISITLAKRQNEAKCNNLGTCYNKYEKRIILKWVPLEKIRQKRISAAPLTTSIRYYPAVTYLKVGNHLANMSAEPPRQSIFNLSALDTFAFHHKVEQKLLLNQFPNLVHLFLGWFESYNPYYEPFYQETIKSCPRLENLVITPTGSMPPTIMSNIDQIEFEDTNLTVIPSTSTKAPTPTPATGLRRFVLTDCNRSQEQKHLIPIFKRHHTTLELLYLDYDNMGMSPFALHKLGSLGCPQLREFRLSSVTRMLRKNILLHKNKKTMKTSGQLLVQLFSSCPALQVIELNEETPIRDELSLEINATVLETIALKCPHLTYFSFNSDCPSIYLGHGGYSCKNFLCFIKNNYTTTAIEKEEDNECVDDKQQGPNTSSRLACLKVPEIDPATALTLVQNLVSLKHLRVLKWSYYNPNPTSGSDDNETLGDSREIMAPVKQILESRGGSLVLD